MNQRIQELADEAAKFSAIMALPTGEPGDKLFVKKFAELIVKECMTVARKADGLDAEYEAWYLIKQHFGVEE